MFTFETIWLEKPHVAKSIWVHAGSKNKNRWQNICHTKKWVNIRKMIIMIFMAIYSCFFSNETLKIIIHLKYVTDQKIKPTEERRKKNLWPKNVNRYEKEPNKKCALLWTNSNCLTVTQLDVKPIFFLSVIDMHWFLRPSTSSWWWCFYLCIGFIVGLSLPFFFYCLSFFNAKYSYSLWLTDIRIFVYWDNKIFQRRWLCSAQTNPKKKY